MAHSSRVPAITSVPISLIYWRGDPVGMAVRVQVTGVLRLSGATLAIEFEEAWRDPNTFQSVRGEVRRAEIPVEQLSSASLRRRFLRGPAMMLQASSLDAIKDFPARRGPECVIGFARRDAAQAEEFVSDLGEAIADLRLRRVQSGEA